jgi:integrase
MLTAKRIAKFLKTPGKYWDGRGLMLRVRSKTNASWVFRYQRDGKEHQLGLGPYYLVSLKEAREKALDLKRKLLNKIDPLSERRDDAARRAVAAAKSMTFEEAARAFFNAHEKEWRNPKHRAQFWTLIGRYVNPIIGKLPVAAIDTSLVMKVLEQRHADHPDGDLWHAVPQSASRVRGRIENILDWAVAHELRTGENPARWKGHLIFKLAKTGKIAKTVHFAACPYSQLPAFMVELRSREGWGSRALAFAILTAARTGEVVGARWDEIDLDTAVWTVPASRMKMGREHRVPLSDAAITLRGLLRDAGNPFVFPGSRAGRGLSDMAMTTVLRRMGRGDITVHGFRSSFRDWAAERMNFPSEVVEKALAHTIGSKVQEAYQRGDMFEKRRRVMSAWADFCAGVPSSADVLPISRGRR